MSDAPKIVALRPADSTWVPLEQRRGPQPLSSLWELFFESASFITKDESTKSNLRRAHAWCGMLGMAEFPQPGDVQNWIARLRMQPGKKKGSLMSGNTVTLYRDCLHSLFEWARSCGKGWTVELGNPVDPKLCPFQRGKALRHALRNIDGVWPFLLATAGEGKDPYSVRHRALLAVYRYLGVRRAEALGLTADSVEVDDDGVWWVRVLGQREADEWVLGPPKTASSRRRLPCRPELRALLAEVMKLGRTTRIAVGHGGFGGEREVPFLFPFRPHDLEAFMLQLRGVAGDDFSHGNAWHVFRHTVAVEMERAGVPVEKTSEWLGHTSVAQTMKYLRTITGHRVDAGLLSYFNDAPKGGPPRREAKRARPVVAGPALPPHPRTSQSVPLKNKPRRPRSTKDEISL